MRVGEQTHQNQNQNLSRTGPGLAGGGVVRVMLLAGIAAIGFGCEREARHFREAPPAARLVTIRQSDIQPGPTVSRVETENPYERNAWAVSEGQRLYTWFNCVGCHFHGGGGIGPPLMDEEWIYGSDPANVFASIVEGRPNGMPSFGGRIPDQQVWKIVAYVRSLSGLVRSDVASGRSDHMKTVKPPQAIAPEQPKSNSDTP